MKKITLKKLSLENWRGQSVSLSFSSEITEVRAKNGAGKSTLFSAWVWLLCGVDFRDNANFELFNKREEVSKDTPAATVEAEIDVDGTMFTIKRSAKSQWTRPRGKDEWVKSPSDKYSFFVDGVEYQAKQYQDFISQLFMGQDADMIKMMVNPNQSQCLEWKTLRKMFQRIIGEITEGDYEGDYSLIEESIRQHGFDIAKQSVVRSVSDLNKSLAAIASDISAKAKTLPDLTKCDEAQRQIEEKKARIADIDRELLGAGEKNIPFIEKRKQEEEAIRLKEQEIKKAKEDYYKKVDESISEVKKAYEDAESESRKVVFFNRELEGRIRELQADISSLKSDIEYLSESRDELLKQKEAVKSRTFVYNDTCPTCGQTLPYDEKAISEARMRFNDAKEKEVELVVFKGKKVRSQLDERKARLEDAEAKLPTLVRKEPVDYSALKEKYETARASVVSFEDTDEYKKLAEELSCMQDNRTEIPQMDDMSAITEEKSRLLNEVQTLSEITAYRSIHEKISLDIEKREKERKATAQALATQEQALMKYQEKEREHANIISTRVNKFLKIANVKMQSLTKGGEYVDCCVVTCDEVGKTMNHASEIRIGVDVASAFQRYFSISAPIFVDEVDCIAEELIPETDGQQIRLRFDKTYETLTVMCVD
jgi:DNA repair exonuclease SbcCD ATPase subunit